MADIKQMQVGAWNAAAIAAEESQEVAVSIICEMELVEKYCDPSDWEKLVSSFCGVDNLRKAIYG